MTNETTLLNLWRSRMTFRLFIAHLVSGAGGSILVIYDWHTLTIVILLTLFSTGVFIEVHPAMMTQLRIQKPPGSLLVKITEFLFSKKICAQICTPTIADMREEYFEAHSQNRIWKARWVLIRGTYSFFAAIGLDRAFAFVSFFIKAWKSVN